MGSVPISVEHFYIKDDSLSGYVTSPFAAMPLSDEETSNLRQNVGSDCPVVSGEYGFRPPQSGDSRGVCPALNTMANHGYM